MTTYDDHAERFFVDFAELEDREDPFTYVDESIDPDTLPEPGFEGMGIADIWAHLDWYADELAELEYNQRILWNTPYLD